MRACVIVLRSVPLVNAQALIRVGGAQGLAFSLNAARLRAEADRLCSSLGPTWPVQGRIATFCRFNVVVASGCNGFRAGLSPSLH